MSLNFKTSLQSSLSKEDIRLLPYYIESSLNDNSKILKFKSSYDTLLYWNTFIRSDNKNFPSREADLNKMFIRVNDLLGLIK